MKRNWLSDFLLYRKISDLVSDDLERQRKGPPVHPSSILPLPQLAGVPTQKLATQLLVRSQHQPRNHVSWLLRSQQLSRLMQTSKFLCIFTIHDAIMSPDFNLHICIYNSRPDSKSGDIWLLDTKCSSEMVQRGFGGSVSAPGTVVACGCAGGSQDYTAVS